ncbi:MAG: hypothetical protein AAFV29_05500, partial [Myxococcota bacterium]
AAPTGVDREGARRANVALARLHAGMARLHARGLLGYLNARHRSGAQPIPNAAEVAVVAAAVANALKPPKLEWMGTSPDHTSAGQTPQVDGVVFNPVAMTAALFDVDCTQPASSSAEIVGQHLRCASPSCPQNIPAPPGHGNEDKGGLWSERFDAFAAALCDPLPNPVSVERWVIAPVLRATLRMPEEIVDHVEVELYDPLAMWVSAQLGFKAARSLQSHPPLSDRLAYVLSSAPDGAPLEPIVDLEASRLAARRAKEVVAESRRCADGRPGHALVDELGIGDAIADGILRRTAESALADGRCDDALALLRSTVDPAATDRITFKNDPGFLVQLATAAVCMQRLPEAIGALRAVRASYKEAQGTLTAVEQLAVARLMGGVGGVQKRQ